VALGDVDFHTAWHVNRFFSNPRHLDLLKVQVLLIVEP